jgi:hypothetical protein
MKNNIYVYAYMGTVAERAIVDYRLLFAGINKLPFSVSVWSIQTEVCHLYVPFASDSWKLPFSVCSIVHGSIFKEFCGSWNLFGLVITSAEFPGILCAKFRRIPGEELYGIPKEWPKLLYFENVETWRILKFYEKIKQKTKNRIPCDFSWSVYCLLIVQREFCCLSVCWRRNKRKLSVCNGTKRIRRSEWTCPSTSVYRFKD